jgi:sucrose-phosphate synthase
MDQDSMGKFAVIPPGVNLDIFDADRKAPIEDRIAERIIRMLGRDIPGNRRELPVVICSSRLDRKKNHLGLIKAWAVSRELRRTANLAIVTRGVSNPLESWEKDFQGEERSVFAEIVGQIEDSLLRGCVSAFDLNSQEELAACYRYLSRNKRGIFALSSIYEPFGLAPLEAMAAGLPAVVTRNGGPKEILRDEGGVYGVLVDPEDPEDIARGLLELIQDETRRQDVQMHGRQRVLDRYTWRRTAQGYLGEFHRILGGADSENREFVIPGDTGEAWLRKLYYDGDNRRSE